MGWSLKEADFIPSEEWLGEYMGEQGLRYRMDKTPKEVEEEGEFDGWWSYVTHVLAVLPFPAPPLPSSFGLRVEFVVRALASAPSRGL